MKLGIDAGGTLIKIAYIEGESDSIRCRTFSSSHIEDAAEWILKSGSAEICVTGGKAKQLEACGVRPQTGIVEFEATYRGVRYLLQEEGVPLESFILTNVGTGTSIHYLSGHTHRRVGGTGVGGGTIMGLSYALTGLADFDELLELAANGSREQIDLKVRHIYEGAEPPIPGELTASNFGRLNLLADLDGLSKSDLLSSVIGLVGETVATTSVLAAGQCQAATVVFIGSSFIGNELLKDAVEGYTRLRGATPMFLENGAYCGAIGALLQLGS
ncbi:type II pantothenate kinase [Paenibacillus sp. 1011MAR3C5]|uniref:type II pantothenate kinase n=1 Tax=Paenibacillus sp. 1011MAR3C5 TaxID=1675787 RepID=UPI000E6BD739|nr:type II pantothenate kinase [Paenibacillus sp. 1011MAR3C5]RJE88406.1 type II pantothenate kinase [Paenibacillus sp. 1011MAR3C5]